MNILKSNPQELNALLSLMDSLTSCVFWICTPDYQKQIFLSQSYEKIWGRCGNILRETGLKTWPDTLVFDDFQTNLEAFCRRPNTLDAVAMVYRVQCPNGNIRYIKDTSYTLFNDANEAVALAGMSESISAENWDVLYQNEAIMVSKQSFLKDCINILKKNYRLSLNTNVSNHSPFTNIPSEIQLGSKTIHITPKQQICISLLMEGLSAKKIARKMNISYRTVEGHLDNLRVKLNCHSRLSLISELQQAILMPNTSIFSTEPEKG